MTGWHDAYDEIRDLKADGRFAEALARLQPVAEAERVDGDIVDAISATMQESLLLGFTGDRDLALARASWAISRVHMPEHASRLREQDAAFTVATAFFIFVSSAADQGDVHVERIDRVLDAAEQFVESVGRPSWRSGVLAERARLAYKRDQFDDAVRFLREAIELKLADPNAPGVALESMRRNLGKYLDQAGRHDEAAEYLRELAEDPSLAGLDRFAVWIYLAGNAEERRDIDEAIHAIGQAQSLAETMHDPQRLIAHGAAVEVWLVAGDLDRAYHESEAELRIARRLGTRDALWAALQGGFDVALARRELAAAARFLEELVPIAERFAQTGLPQVLSEVTTRREQLSQARGES